MLIRLIALCEDDFFICSIMPALRLKQITTVDVVSRQDKFRLNEVAKNLAKDEVTVILLDENRHQLINFFKQLPEKPKVILFVNRVNDAILNYLKTYDFDGFFYHESNVEHIVTCIKSVHEGKRYICP